MVIKLQASRPAWQKCKLLYIVVVLCTVIGQLRADKCDYHAICRQFSYLFVDYSAICMLNLCLFIIALSAMFIFSARNV